MSKRIIRYFFSLIIMLCSISVVKAEFVDKQNGLIERNLGASTSFTGVSVTGSVLEVRASTNVDQFCIGTTNNVNATSTYCEKGNNSSKHYFGVMNGTYYLWLKPLSTSGTNYISYGKGVSVTSSCTDEKKSNVSGTTSIKKCLVSNSSSKLTFVSGLSNLCASGLKYDSSKTSVLSNGCSNITTIYGGQQLKYAYCGVTYSVTCSSNGSGNTEEPPGGGGESGGGGSGGGGGGGSSATYAHISSLSITGYQMDRAFDPNFYQMYHLLVPGNVTSIHISMSSNDGTIDGGNEQDFYLSAVDNYITLSVRHSSGTVRQYKIMVTRSMTSINTLSNLTVSAGTLSPAFSSDVTSYSLEIPFDVNVLNVNATLTDGSSSFEEGFGPRSIDVSSGQYIIYIKVRSQSGDIKYYTINAYKSSGSSEECEANVDSLALLKSFEFTYNGEPYDYDLSPEFDPTTYYYEAIVPFKVGNLTVEATVQDEGDTFVVLGGQNLEVGVQQVVSITVTSKVCPNINKVYNIGVKRDFEKNLGTNPDIKSFTINGHKEFKFEQNETQYDIILNKGEDKLDYKIETVEEGTQCVVEGNENLSVGSDILVTCTSEDGNKEVNYQLTVSGIKKGTNTFLLIIIIIIVALIIIYLILRLLGYKIYFNFEVIGAFFRGIGEKFTNMFDR